MKSSIILSFATLMLLASCGGAVTKNNDGVTVKLNQDNPNDTRLVRLTVMDEKIIRVSATPDDKFADQESLVVLPKSKDVFVYEYDVELKNN